MQDRPTVRRSSLSFPLEEYTPPDGWIGNGDRCGDPLYNWLGWRPKSLGVVDLKCTELFGIYHPDKLKGNALRLELARQAFKRRPGRSIDERLTDRMSDPISGLSTFVVCELILAGDVDLVDD